MPLLADNTVACSVVSMPVAGLVLIILTILPTYFSNNLAGVSKSKSKFCSCNTKLPGLLMLLSSAVSGLICALTSRSASLLTPVFSMILR